MLVIGERELHALRKHAEEAYPAECCGVLIGHIRGEQRAVSTVVGCENASPDRRWDRYIIDPKDLVRIQRQAREAGQEIVGFYHSHPDHPAQWSRTDLDQAHWIGYSYVITSVSRGVPGETNSFLLTGAVEEDKRFVAEELNQVAG